MDNQSLKNVLGILRLLIKGKSNESAAQFIERVSGKNSADHTLRIAAYIVCQFDEAIQVINNSQLTGEAKAGFISVLDILKHSFSLSQLGNVLSSAKSAAPGAISNFVILLSASGVDMAESQPSEANDLAQEVEALVGAFDDAQLDPGVREVARKHLVVLATLLRHIPIFGIEASLVSYFELVMKLRRADIDTSAASKEKLNPLWEKIEKWGTRLGVIDKAVNAGARLAKNADKAIGLLDYIPPPA